MITLLPSLGVLFTLLAIFCKLVARPLEIANANGDHPFPAILVLSYVWANIAALCFTFLILSRIFA